MRAVKIKSYAKVNLTLEIVGEENGYHALDSLVASVDLFDLISLKKRKDGLNFVRMHGMDSESIPPEENNAWKAADAFVKKFGTTGADITIYKNIPMGSGLGGSSADTAGVLNGMAKLYGVEDRFDELKEIADRLGSDTGYMLKGGFARMQGRGTSVTPLPIRERLYFLLICPKESVSTKACYRAFDKRKGEAYPEKTGENTEKCIRALLDGDQNEAGRYLTNDLYAPAASLSLEVKKAYEAACGFSPLGAVMTGSGSAVLLCLKTRNSVAGQRAVTKARRGRSSLRPSCPKRKAGEPPSFYRTRSEESRNRKKVDQRRKFGEKIKNGER